MTDGIDDCSVISAGQSKTGISWQKKKEGYYFFLSSLFIFFGSPPGHGKRRGIRGDSPGANGTNFLKV